jgi:hypothetical protein
LTNRGDGARNFEITVVFFGSKAKLSDGIVQNIETGTNVKWEVEFSEIYPQDLENMEEKAVKNFVEKIGENIIWGPDQEVSLLRFDNLMGEYVRIVNGEEMVAEIDRQDGWTSKQASFYAELVDLKFDSKVGYVASKLASQIADDEWALQRQIVPKLTEVTKLADGVDVVAQDGCHGAPNVVSVDWNLVQLEERTDLVIAPMTDIEMAKMFGISVDDRDKRKKSDKTNFPANANINSFPEDVDEELMQDAADNVDDAHDDELVNLYDKENPVIEVGSLWPNMDEFRMCFKTYAVKQQFDAKTMWTDRKKFYARCKGFDGSANPCKWYISARRQPDGRTIRVNQIPHKHTCITSKQRASTMTSQFWVTEKITPILAKTPNSTVKKLKVDLEKQYPIVLKYTTVWKAKQRAMKSLYGDWANTFRMLYNFKAEVEKRSPGSVVEIDTEVTEDGKVYFSKFFMCLKPCIDGFKAGCRPYLSINSSVLTGKWNGQLAACNALDGHNWMFPVAIGLFQSETEASWTWFMMQLKMCIGPVSPLAIHTDTCKGLENVIKNIFPHAEQRECFGHMWMNLIRKFRGDDYERMWPAARSYTKQAHSYHLGKIVAADPGFGTWLNTYHSLLWYRSGFNTAIKCDHINNNLAESFNNKVRVLKELPVHDMVDQIRIMIMRLWELRKRIGDLLEGDKLPAVVQLVVNRSRNQSHLSVEKSSQWIAEVRDTKSGKRHVVNTDLHECTCLEWQHTGKPCEHAIIFLASKPKLNMHQYLHEYYSIARFRAAYATPIPALTDQSQWPEVDIEFTVFPPITTRKAGRPKQSRFKEWFEKGGCREKGTKDKDVKRKRAQKGNRNRCKMCEELGHRIGSPKCRYTAARPKYVNLFVYCCFYFPACFNI